MRKLHLLFAMWLFVGTSSMFAQVTTIQTDSVVSTGIYCPGSSVNVLFSTTGDFLLGNTFTAQLSDGIGSFASPTVIGTLDLAGTDPADTIFAVMPMILAADTGYRIRVIADLPGTIGTENNTNLKGGPTPPQGMLSALSGTVCAGTFITLTATADSTYTGLEYVWYKNGAAIHSGTSDTYLSAAGLVADTNLFEVAIAYSGYYCLSEVSLAKTIVTNAPQATITPVGAGPTTFCANSPTTLSAPTGMTNYVWKRSGGAMGPITLQSGPSTFYIPNTSGNHNVTVTDAQNCTKTSAWINITVKPLPNANAGIDKNVCPGGSVQIGVPYNPANTYQWGPNNNLSDPTTSNPFASPTANTTYTVLVTNISTGCINADAVAVNILTPPNAPTLYSTTNPVCQGSSIILSAGNYTGSTSINWYRNGTLISNKVPSFMQNITIPTAAADVYNIAGKGANGCVSALSNTLNIWVKEAPLPVILSSPPAVGSTITVCEPGGSMGTANLSASSPTANYSWKLAGAFVPNANTNVYSQVVSTTSNNKVVTLQATYPNGCVKTSAPRTVKLVTSGCVPRMGDDKEDAFTASSEQLSVTTYPNPATDMLNIDIVSSEISEGKIVIYNLLGQIVLQKTVTFEGNRASETLDLRNVAAGVYSLSFQSAIGNTTQKIVKE